MSSLFHLSAKEINSCLRYIAELRVQGKEWEEVAQDLERPVKEVHRFVFQHEQVFRQCMKKAHLEQKHLCYCVAYEVLRQQTASKNEKLSHSAACMLLRMKLSDDRLKLKKLQQQMLAQAQENKKAAAPALKVPQVEEAKTPLPTPDQLTPLPVTESEIQVEAPVVVGIGELTGMNA